MKIFISWSGELSHKVAVALRDWLPSVIQSVSPYVSSEDIDKGARWSSDIASELDQSAFGILCVTKDNVSAPWLNFEAGALGKSIDKSKVCPFLFKIKRSEVEGPILQYQSTIYDNADTFKLLKSINDACDDDSISEQQLEKAFKVWWPQLQDSLDSIEEVKSDDVIIQDSTGFSGNDYVSNILEELLELSRTNQKLLRDPESILPESYFNFLFRNQYKDLAVPNERLSNYANFEISVFKDIVQGYINLVTLVNNIGNSERIEPTLLKELKMRIRHIDAPLGYITQELGNKLPNSLMKKLNKIRL